MTTRKFLGAALAATAAFLAMAASSGAWPSPAYSPNSVTFSGPVALPGIVLPAGSYIFEKADFQGAPDVVRVLSGDRRSVYVMAFTRQVDRPEWVARDKVITFGEFTPGAAPPISTWFPIDSDTGHQFIYPDDAR